MHPRPVLTSSGAIYLVDITNPDTPPRLTRHRAKGELLHDSSPLPGVHALRFDALTGIGRIEWWKDDPAHYDRPDLPSTGTIRATSRVLLIARLREATTTATVDAIDWLRALVRTLGDPYLDYSALVSALAKQTSENGGHEEAGL